MALVIFSGYNKFMKIKNIKDEAWVVFNNNWRKGALSLERQVLQRARWIMFNGIIRQINDKTMPVRNAIENLEF